MDYPSEKGYKTFEITDTMFGTGYYLIKVTDSIQEKTSIYVDTIAFKNNKFIPIKSNDTSKGLFKNFQYLIPFHQPNGKAIKIFYINDTLIGNYSDSILNSKLYFDKFGYVYGDQYGGNMYCIEKYRSTIKFLKFNDNLIKTDDLLSLAISTKVRTHMKQIKTNIHIRTSEDHIMIKGINKNVNFDKLELFDCAGKRLCVFTNLKGPSVQIDNRYAKRLKIVNITVMGQCIAFQLANRF